MRLKMERVCVFIDGSNLYHGLKNECGRTDLSFAKFVGWLVGQRHLVRTYYYNAPLPPRSAPEQIKAQQRFFDGLNRLPYFAVKLGRLEPRGDTYVEKGIDVSIAVDMLSMAVKNVYDTAILVSSDGDYVQAVTAVQDTGRHVEAACFRRAHRLKQSADKVISLDAKALSSLWLG